MASKALVIARKTVAATKRRFEDQRLQAAATSLVGGAGAALIDKEGVQHIGETPIVLNFAIGLGIQALCLLPFTKRMPFRAAAAGLGMGMTGAGAYVQMHELQGTTELTLTPTFRE